VVAIWGWLIVAFFVMFIGLGMAEICSTYPTAGGLYFWTAKLYVVFPTEISGQRTVQSTAY
jgi:amino acid transporter